MPQVVPAPEQPAIQKPPAPSEPPPVAAAPAPETERQLCDALAGHAKLRAEDAPRGVVIVVTPRTARETPVMLDDTRRLDAMMRLHTTEAGPIGETCGLFMIGRLPGVTTKITEGANTTRILMTTVRPAELKALRRIAREQVGAMTNTNKR
jgi:hypothetical protein